MFEFVGITGFLTIFLFYHGQERNLKPHARPFERSATFCVVLNERRKSKITFFSNEMKLKLKSPHDIVYGQTQL